MHQGLPGQSVVLVYAQGAQFIATSIPKIAPANPRLAHQLLPGLSYEARTLTVLNWTYLEARPALWTDESKAAIEAPAEAVTERTAEAAAERTAETYTEDNSEEDHLPGYLAAEHLEIPGFSDLYL